MRRYAVSVLMTLRVSGDSKGIEATPQETLDTIIARAKENGLIAHRFWGNGSEIFVVDEWQDQGSFQKFFDSSPEIPEMMRAAGVTSEPTVEFWSPLDVDDRVG
jgi:hypothetical protein